MTTSEKTIGVLAALLRNVIIGLLASLMTAIAMGKSGVRGSRHRCHDDHAIAAVMITPSLP